MKKREFSIIIYILNKIPQEYYNCIKKEKNYLKIINHPSYTPRIIEYITEPYKNIKRFYQKNILISFWNVYVIQN